MTLNPLQSDRFIWKWSSKYSASSTYRAFFAGSTTLLGARELWKTKAPPRVKFFFWLALHIQLWTAERRKRHELQEVDDCALCAQAPETEGHLFLGCVFARELWFSLLLPIGLATIMPEHDEDIGEWWMRQRRRLDPSAGPVLDSMFLLVAWNL